MSKKKATVTSDESPELMSTANVSPTTIGGGDTSEQLAKQFATAIKHIDAIVIGAIADGVHLGINLFPALKAACVFSEQVSDAKYPDIINADSNVDGLSVRRFPVTDEDVRRIQEGDEASLKKLRMEERRLRIIDGDLRRYPYTAADKRLVKAGDANALRILAEDQAFWKEVETNEGFCESLGFTKPEFLAADKEKEVEETDDAGNELDFDSKKEE